MNVSVRPPRRRRLSQLYAGLVLYGLSDGMLLLAGLGVDPWDVLQQGLSRDLGLRVGTWALIVGIAVLCLWVPLRQRPGFGTLSNALLIGPVIDIALVMIPAPHAALARWSMMLSGVLLNGMATGAYIGAGLGPGPRDGLMTGLAAHGYPIRRVRTAIELTVLFAGWLLGGTVGIGTVAYAVTIGPMVHLLVPRLQVSRPMEPRPPAGPQGPVMTRVASASELGRVPHRT